MRHALKLVAAIAIATTPSIPSACETGATLCTTAGSYIGEVLVPGPAGVIGGALIGSLAHETYHEIIAPPLPGALQDSYGSAEELEEALGNLGIDVGSGSLALDRYEQMLLMYER